MNQAREATAGTACDSGWHRTSYSRGCIIKHAFFRFAGGAEGRMLIYRVGPRPLEKVAATISMPRHRRGRLGV
jgi:hypothetical protein